MSTSLTQDELAAVLALTNKAMPTRSELVAALDELYSSGPTLYDLLANGQLTFTPDGKHLRLPPPAPAELWQRSHTPPKERSEIAQAAPVLVVGSFSFYEGGGIE